jgi:hypothetical protein
MRMTAPSTASRDLRVLFASRMVRLFGCGLFAVVLAFSSMGSG